MLVVHFLMPQWSVPYGGGGIVHVGYSLDMSVDLVNASHFGVHDALQGFSVWTEEMPGLASN